MQDKEFIQQLQKHFNRVQSDFPEKGRAQAFIDDFFEFLFVPAEKEKGDEAYLSGVMGSFRNQLFELIKGVSDKEDNASSITQSFFDALPYLHAELLKDAASVLEFDPAAYSLEEVLVAYPGFYATAIYRLSNQLWKKGVRILPRIFSEHAHSKTGIDIHPGASIGHSFFIDHGTGIVIGETSVIGNNVKIYQGVTLGALSVSKDQAQTKRHPTIEDHVVIYSGATILGGDTVVGKHSLIGGNVWLTHSVLPNSIVYHKSEVTIRDKNPLSEALNFVI
ncbi:MAG: serine acetyltransferase [Ferruginibacter sp.]|nr:serine acetyltransferase [Ferruginibacter sp.]